MHKILWFNIVFGMVFALIMTMQKHYSFLARYAVAVLMCGALLLPNISMANALRNKSSNSTGIYEGAANVSTARGNIVQAPEKFNYSMDCYEKNGIDARTAYTEWYFVKNRKTIAECLGLGNQLPVKNETYMTTSSTPCSAVSIEEGIVIQRGPSRPQHNRIRCANNQRQIMLMASLTLPKSPSYIDVQGNRDGVRLPNAPTYLDARLAPTPPAPSSATTLPFSTGAQYNPNKNKDVKNTTATDRLPVTLSNYPVDSVASKPFQSASKTPNVFHGAPSDMIKIVRDAAVKNGLNPRLLLSMVSIESSFNPNARSPKGAVGLLQLMPDTARGLGLDPALRTDPRRNADAGARYIKEMLRKYNHNLPLALAAYNAGPDAVDKANGVPNYSETKEYIEKVLAGFKSDIYTVYLVRN